MQVTELPRWIVKDDAEVSEKFSVRANERN